MSVVEPYSSMSNEHDPKYDPKFAEDKPEDREVRDLVVSPTGTQMSPENEIIELDAHLGEPKVDHPQYKQPELRSQDFAVLADGLGEVGAYHESSLLEAERKKMVEYDDYAPTFTAKELTEIAVQCIPLRIHVTVADHEPLRQALTNFSDTIDESHDAPLDESYEGIKYTKIEPKEGNYIDPFSVVASTQSVHYYDDEGPYYPDTSVALSDYPRIET